MKNCMKLFAMTGLIILVVSLNGFAQGVRRDCARGVNARQQRQQQRILNGVRTDELTRREVGRLETQQARIAAAEARARTSGDGFTLRERARIQDRLNRASRNIYRQKHDQQEQAQ